jgi:hypothetical protein
MIEFLPAHGRSSLQALARRLAMGVSHDGGGPLPRLADVHPGHPTGGRWIGLGTVPVDCIRGTASMGASRGRNFRPLAGREPSDWRFRWSRLTAAARDQAMLPPVQLLRASGDYWVVDGHNRVALAKERGQVWIDAEITELDLSPDHAVAGSAKES